MLTIRLATADDAPTILGFIRELAAHMGESDSVELTEERLGEQLGLEDPHFECIVAAGEIHGEERDVGMALFYSTYSTWTGLPGIHLEDLYVDSVARGLGVGRALMAELARLARNRGGARLEWAVTEDNEIAMRFYDHVGADAMHDWITRRLEGEALDRLADQAVDRRHIRR